MRYSKWNIVCMTIVSLIVSLVLATPVAAQEAPPDNMVSEYNHLPTGKEILTLAGPLPEKDWAPPVNDVLNVRLMGAKGDGVTDDTKALQEVFKNVDHGQEIFFPAGKYLISDTLKLTGRYGVRINMHGGFCSGNKRTIYCRGIFWSTEGPKDRPMMLIYDSNHTVLNGLNLDGGGRAQDGLIIDAASCSNFTTGYDMFIRSCARYGMRIATFREGHPVGGPQVDVLGFHNCKFTNSGSKEYSEDAQVTVESAQALIILFETCEFSTAKYGEYNVYIRGGRPQFVNASFGSQPATIADIFIGNNYTAAASVYMAHSEGANPNRYFLKIDRPEPGGIFTVVLDNIGASAKVLFNASHQIQISNCAFSSIDIPCPNARAVLSNVIVQGDISFGTKDVSTTNVVIQDPSTGETKPYKQ